MTKQFCLLLAAFAVFAVPVFGQPPVPCPQYFRYVANPYGQVEGLLTLPYDYSTSLDLSVNASMAGYYGRNTNMKLKLLTPAQDLLFKNTQFVRYQLTFPVQESIPQITEIALNGAIFCSGPQVPVTMTTSVTNLWTGHNFHFTAPRSGLMNLAPNEMAAIAPPPEYYEQLPPVLPVVGY